MNNILQEQRFDYVSPSDKAFILAFNEEMTRRGYTFNGSVGSGYCWGKYMVIYTKAGVKSKNVYARIYIRDTDLVLRLFLNNVAKHSAYIEQAPVHIKSVLTEGFGDSIHDKDMGDGKCMFRKSYTLDGRLIEKCNGNTFWFFHPRLEELKDYVALFTEFYPENKKK